MPVSKRDYIVPSALLCEHYRSCLSQPGFLERRLESLAKEGFYREAEILPIESKEERRALAAVLKAARPRLRNVTVWLSGLLKAHNLNVASVEPEGRQKAVTLLKKQVDAAAECGATQIALYGGEDTGLLQRSEAFKALMATLKEVSTHARKAGLSVLIKPSGRYARSSKKLLALSPDVRELLDLTKQDCPNLFTVYDTAHIALNSEDLHGILKLFGADIRLVHLSNAILDFKNPHYGQRHIAPGEPGFLTAREVQELVSYAWELELFRRDGLAFSVHYRQLPSDTDTDRVFAIATDFLKQIIFEFLLQS